MTMIVPLIGSRRRAKRRRSVLLPAPLGPIKAVWEQGSSEKEILLRRRGVVGE